MRDIGVDESEELPLILRPLVDDGGGAAVGALTPEPLRLAVLQAVRDATPALMQLQVGTGLCVNHCTKILPLFPQLWLSVHTPERPQQKARERKGQDS
jgi:hypothetical protein